jgi:hypothetical protein
MADLLKGIVSIPPPFNMIVLIFLIIAVSGVIASLFKQIRKYACHQREIELKRELVDRGLSVDEIERIVAAKGSATSRDSEV